MDIDRKKSINDNRRWSTYAMRSSKDGAFVNQPMTGCNELLPYDQDEIREHMRDYHIDRASGNGNKFQHDFTWG